MKVAAIGFTEREVIEMNRPQRGAINAIEFIQVYNRQVARGVEWDHVVIHEIAENRIGKHECLETFETVNYLIKNK